MLVLGHGDSPNTSSSLELLLELRRCERRFCCTSEYLKLGWKGGLCLGGLCLEKHQFVKQSEGREAPRGAGLSEILYGNEKRVVKAPQ